MMIILYQLAFRLRMMKLVFTAAGSRIDLFLILNLTVYNLILVSIRKKCRTVHGYLRFNRH